MCKIKERKYRLAQTKIHHLPFAERQIQHGFNVYYGHFLHQIPDNEIERQIINQKFIYHLQRVAPSLLLYYKEYPNSHGKENGNKIQCHKAHKNLKRNIGLERGGPVQGFPLEVDKMFEHVVGLEFRVILFMGSGFYCFGFRVAGLVDG